MNLEAYLFFPGNTEEAMNHYKEILGGELAITHRGDVDPTAEGDEKNQVINAGLDTGSFVLRASDRPDATNEPQTRVELTISGTDENKLRAVFERLADGGAVKVPLEKQFWGDTFGGLVDKYGIGWQINITQTA